MDAWLQQLAYWHWWLLGVVLLLLEMFAPGVFFLWMGLAAGVVGVWLLLQPALGWQIQVLAFAVLSVGLAVLGRWWLTRHPIATDEPRLNRRGEQYIDRVFTLDDAVINGVGKLRVDDTTWKINGPDCGAGTQVRVTGVDGVVLQVEPLGGVAAER
ncbi:MAG: hypothetical protein RLZ44_69 [Pseudomonadota bacterium]|jgi:membrane protein implicated in regulation of membrane protease activity